MALNEQALAKVSQEIVVALQVGEKEYGPEHPTVAIRVNNLGVVLRELGELVIDFLTVF